MEKVHLALVQSRWTGSQDTMKELTADLVAAAAKTGANLIGLPEFSITPYFPGVRDDAGFRWAEQLETGVSSQFFGQLASQHDVTIIGSLFEQDKDGNYWDTATIHGADGNLSHFTRKVHIPSGEGYYETDYFEGYNEFPVHDIGVVKLAAPTCYDQWFPELARIYALNGVEHIHYPTAIGSEPTDPEFDSSEAWQTVMRGHAIANGIFISAANRVGHENDVTFYGSSFICDPTGRILAKASRDETEVIHAELDPAVRNQYLELFPLLHQRRPHTYSRILEKYTKTVPERWAGHKDFED